MEISKHHSYSLKFIFSEIRKPLNWGKFHGIKQSSRFSLFTKVSKYIVRWTDFDSIIIDEGTTWQVVGSLVHSPTLWKIKTPHLARKSTKQFKSNAGNSLSWHCTRSCFFLTVNGVLTLNQLDAGIQLIDT